MLDLDENTPLNKDNITFCGHLASIEIFATHWFQNFALQLF